jgi:hypothetical protein
MVTRLPSLRAVWPKNQSSETEKLRVSLADGFEKIALRYDLPWMGTEGINQEPSVPNRNRAMGKRRTANFSSKSSLQSTDLIFEVLSLLAQSTAWVIRRPHRLDSVADTLDHIGESVAHDGKVGRKRAIVIDQQDVFVSLRGIAADVLSYTVERRDTSQRFVPGSIQIVRRSHSHLASNRAPNMVDPVLLTNLFGLV